MTTTVATGDDLDTANRDVKQILFWAWLIVEMAHGKLAASPEVFEQLEATLGERRRRIEAVRDPLRNGGARSKAIAGVNGSSAHDAAATLASKLLSTARDTLWRSMLGGGLHLDTAPTWSDVRGCWPQVAAALRAFDAFDWEPVRDAIDDETDNARTETPDDDNGKKVPKRNVDLRMQALVQINPAARHWTCRQWAEYLKCSTPAVTKSDTWKELAGVRASLAADREMRTGKRTDRRRKPRRRS